MNASSTQLKQSFRRVSRRGEAEVIEWALRGFDRQHVKLPAARAGFSLEQNDPIVVVGFMKRFFFDLVGDTRAHDFMGHECSSKSSVNPIVIARDRDLNS